MPRVSGWSLRRAELYTGASVTLEATTVDLLASGLLGSVTLILDRFFGPGHAGFQSMYMHYPETR